VLVALLKSRRMLHGSVSFRGLDIAIENQKSSSRGWKNPDNGTEGMSHVKHAYGYFRGSMAEDGDALDVYVGPNQDAANVYVVKQLKAPDYEEYDELKCMLGFDTTEDAKRAYQKQYNNPRFYGTMYAMPFEKFRAMVRGAVDSTGDGKLITFDDIQGESTELKKSHVKLLTAYTLRKSRQA